MKIDNIKSFRILDMYERLNRGEIINKKDFANEFDVSEKSVQRDIDDLRAYLSEAYGCSDKVTIEYDYIINGYRLIRQESEFLTNEEIFAVAKILLESRGLNKQELNNLIDKLLIQATPCAIPVKIDTKKLQKNGMNHSISLIYANRPHLFHGLLDNEPLPV